MDGFSGLGMGLGTLSRLSTAQTRSISAENPTGEPGRGGMATTGTGAHAARDLGPGWKLSPSIVIPAGATATLAAITGAGAIQHLWLTTHPRHWRQLVLRLHWEDDPQPAVAVPLGDFFCQGWGAFSAKLLTAGSGCAASDRRAPRSRRRRRLLGPGPWCYLSLGGRRFAPSNAGA